MKDFLLVLIGVAIARLWPHLKERLRRLVSWIKPQAGADATATAAALATGQQPAASDEAGAAPAKGATDTPPLSANDLLASRLRKLFEEIDPEISGSAHARELAAHPRFVEARGLLADPAVPFEWVRDYAVGASWFYSCAALAALDERPDRDLAIESLVRYFDMLTPWGMYFALKLFLATDPRPPVGAPMFAVREWWQDNVFVIATYREHFDERQRLGDKAHFGSALEGRPVESHDVIRSFLTRVGHPLANALIVELEAARLTNVDRAFLSSFGRFWRRGADDVLIEPAPWKDALAEAEASVAGAYPRSLLVSGEGRVGKTSFLRLLGQRLERSGWTVFEAGGVDLMAGQQWFGQLEGRIQRAIDELSASKKLIWYIPDVLLIALSGTHQGQAASILDQIVPAIAAGRLVVWTEASATGSARLFRLRPGLRSTFEVARIEPMDQDETEALAREFAGSLCRALSVAIEPQSIEVALDSSRQYLTSSSLPGATLDLLRLSIGRAAKSGAGKVEAGDVIETLAQLTGLPASILDSNERVDLAAVRAYFTTRVIGQDEAVDAVVQRIAMLKAGLNDPAKPIGVFMFAGPTGTGKTELAKTLAEYLFGTQERMVRLDMSEFQTAESTAKILGSGEQASPTDSLITLVRKQPFSVVLLDEFEKAHANVWDLFLQVFDDGRLTDQLGQVADFRHCIIILTSNLGATSHRGSRLGFAPGDEAYAGDQVLRAISQTFRPEFQNRLDKVIVFRPLSRELMRGILRKELSRVLERRGFKDREWAVEWESSALEFLLEKGFTPEMGARPLKRAIDQYLIAPLAATIVEKRFPEGDQFVFVRSDGRAIEAEFVDPDLEETSARPAAANAGDDEALALPAMVMAPQGSDAEQAMLEAELGRMDDEIMSGEWEATKAKLTAEMMDAAFWSRPDRFETLARIALMDRVRAAAETARSLKARLDKGAERAGKSSRELVSRIALQIHLVNEGIADVRDRSAIELALAIEPAFERAGDREATLAWCRQLLDMYRAWGRKRNMQVSELPADMANGASALPLLLVSGFGAHRTLKREQGLHALERAEEGRAPLRATARVRVVPAPLEDLPPARLRRALKDAFDRSHEGSNVVRRYRSDATPLVRDLAAGWRSARLDAVLGGDFDLIAVSRT